MIYKQHGIRIKNITFQEKQKSYGEYLDSDIGMGTQVENPELEEIFKEIFSPLPRKYFFYSNFSKDTSNNKFTKDYPNDWFTLEQKPQFGTVVHIKTEILDKYNEAIFSRLKAFLLECYSQNKNQMIAIKIIWEDCNELTFTLLPNFGHFGYSGVNEAIKALKKQYKSLIDLGCFNRVFFYDPDEEFFRE